MVVGLGFRLPECFFSSAPSSSWSARASASSEAVVSIVAAGLDGGCLFWDTPRSVATLRALRSPA